MITEGELALNQELRFHRHLFRPGTFVDIGAHIGDFTFGLADLPDIELVAIEPLPRALATLKRRVARSKQSIKVIGAALGDHAGTSQLQVPILADGGPIWQWTSLVKDFALLREDHPEIVGIQTFEARVTTLDQIGLTNVTAIKLDAEGSEYEVLRGARTSLSTMRPILSVELEERHRIGCTYAVPAFLDALNYVCFFEVSGEILPFGQFDRALMQRGSPSPASREYSSPYVSCFYFLPAEEAGLLERLTKM